MAIISEFYKRLRDLCEERNMTINELVKILNLSNGSPTAWKNGAVPRNTTLAKIADYFGVSPRYLSGEDAKKNNAPDQLVLTEDEIRILAAIRAMSPERQRALADLLGIEGP